MHDTSTSASLTEAAKSIVNKKYNERLEGEANRKSLAHLLHLVKRGSLSGVKFINELFQNADDACFKAKVDAGNIDIILTQNFIIFTHNGKNFEAKDVIAISDCADPMREKINDANQIGNKGIGFKAVFSVSPYVLIRSNPYSFRFDKNYKLWSKGLEAEDWPWEITPIWTDDNDVPVEVKPHLKIDKVVQFILKIDDVFRDEIQKSLIQLSSNASILIFLRKIVQITFTDVIHNMTYTVKKDYVRKWSVTDGDSVSVYKEIVNNTLYAFWYVSNYHYVIPDRLHKEALKQGYLAAKYKNMENMPVSMAIRVVNKKIALTEATRIYCYLPTDIGWPFPFAMSSEFLLDPGRSQIQYDGFEKKWNGDILDGVFQLQFSFIKCLAMDTNTELWKEVVKLILHPDHIQWGKVEDIKRTLVNSFNLGISTNPFLRNMNSSVKLISELKYDRYGFVAAFGDETLKAQCVHPDIAHAENLISCNLAVFNVIYIVEKLKDTKFMKTFQSSESNVQLIRYLSNLYTKLQQEKNYDGLKLLNTFFKDNAFILSSTEQLKKPSEIYFPQKDLIYLSNLLPFISLVSATILNLGDNITKWLTSIGVVNLTLHRIITDTNNYPNHLLPFAKAVFAAHKRKVLKNDKQHNDYNMLKDLKLKTTADVFIAAKNCYMHKDLNPIVALEEVIPDHHYLHVDYWSDGEDRDEIKNFFIQIGVSQTIEENNISEIIKNANKNERVLISAAHALFKAYQASAKLGTALQSAGANLKLLGHDGKYHVAKALYLPDCLEPDYKFEEGNIKVPILSTIYFKETSKHERAQWRKFFIAVGVRTTVSVDVLNNKIFSDITKLAFGEEYYRDCEAGYNDNIAEYYIRISYIENIIYTPYFWLSITNNWNEIKDYLVPNGRTKWHISYKLTSNLVILVRMAIAHHYPKKKPEDMFAPSFRQHLGELANLLPIADIAKNLSEDQLEFFKFKLKLSIKDCLLLLREIMKKEIFEEYQQVSYIYQQLLQNLSVEENKNLVLTDAYKSSFKLLNQLGSFVTVNEAFALIDTDNGSSQTSPLLLYKPAKMSTDDFERLCIFFGVNTFCKEEAVIETHKNSVDTATIELIKRALPLVIIFEAKANDVSSTNLTDYYARRGVSLMNKIAKIKIIKAERVTIKYKSVFRDEVEFFEHKTTTTFYYNPTDDSSLPQLKQALYRYLGLTLDPPLFAQILTNQLKVKQKFHSVTDEKIAEVASILEGLEKKEKDVQKRPSKRPISEESSEEETGTIKQRRKNDDVQAADEESASNSNTHSEENQATVHEQPTLNPSTRLESKISQSPLPAVYPPIYTGSSSYAPIASRLRTGETAASSQAATNQPATLDGDFLSIDEVDMKQIKVDKLKLTKSANKNSSETKDTDNLSEDQRKKVGRLGEKILYEYLKDHYKKKYGSCPIIETAKGFEITGIAPLGKAKQHGALKLQVLWHNINLPYTEDSYQHKDLTIIKNNVERHIEVKSSPSATKSSFTLSSEEKQVMEECKDRYRIFRLFGVGRSKCPVIKRIKNPAAEIEQGNLSITEHTSYTMKI